jgi:hypothetical protein
VPRLIHTELAAAGKPHLRQQAPAAVHHGATVEAALLHAADEARDVVAHQVELVDVVLARGMDRHLRGWEPEDEPALAHVHARQPERVAQERAVGRGVLAIDDGMRADDHGTSSGYERGTSWSVRTGM